MQGSDDDAPGADLPGPPDGAQPVAPIFAPDGTSPLDPAPAEPADRTRGESVWADSTAPPAQTSQTGHPDVAAAGAGPMVPDHRPPTAPPSAEVATRHGGGDVVYRTDRDRNRSVHRLANPWYRRLARIVIGMAFLAAAALAVYAGAQFVRDLLDQDELPEEEAEVPAMRTTTIEIRSTAPAPVLDGTLTLDTVTGSFEFVGRGSGSQAGVQVVSPDGTTTYVRRDAGAWQPAGAGDQLAADVLVAVDYLSDDSSADAILTQELRSDYVDLIERTEIGEGDDQVVRYELRIDTTAFQQNSPFEYQSFEEEAIPGVTAVRGLLVTITVDGDNVLVQVDDTGTNWSWQRLSYSDDAFVPINPSIVAADG